ncbi:MAG: hypothetical protein K2L23_03965 [Odoribacter sp.]|nr:hypothetical protein [Odoribacter sp.]
MNRSMWRWLGMAVLLCLLVTGAMAKERVRFERGIVKRTFVPKGQWFFGGTCSYAETSQENYKFLVLKDWNGSGYQLAIKPFVGYMVMNDLGVGLNFAYERSLFKVDKLNIHLNEDLNFEISDYYILEHVYTASAFLRLFMNIEESKRFGLFNDVKLMFGGGQGKYINGDGDLLEGTYQTIFKMGLIYSPGVAVFINDYAAVEASVGVLGVQMKRTDQTTNNVHSGSFSRSSANFKIDLFSIGLGVSIYL